MTQQSRRPELTVALVGEPQRDGGSVYVTAEVQNQGTETARDVQVVAELVEDGNPGGVRSCWLMPVDAAARCWIDVGFSFP